MARVLVAYNGVIPLDQKEEQWYVGLSDIWDYRAAIDLGILQTHMKPMSHTLANEMWKQISERANLLKSKGSHEKNEVGQPLTPLPPLL